MPRLPALFFSLLLALVSAATLRASETPPPARPTLAAAALAATEAERRAKLQSLVGSGDEAIAPVLEAWRKDELFIHTSADGARTVVQLVPPADAAGTFATVRIDDGQPFTDASGASVRLSKTGLKAVEHTSALRRIMRSVIELLDLAAADPARRIKGVQTLGQAQDATKLPALQARLAIETDPNVLRYLREAIALIQLKDADRAVKLAALAELRELSTLSSSDFVGRALKEAEAAGDAELAKAANSARLAIEEHRAVVDFFGTLFRGVSLGSILLVGALGLAITFGLMRVINMAHGEMIAVGAYTTYMVQNIFGAGITLPCFGLSVPVHGFNLTGGAYQSYFLFALPLSFLIAAGVGILLERCVIRFLYRRPLESLLATWGVSLILQQVFRLTFGSNNVQVSSPVYLSGNWTVNDVLFGWNRVFVIGFAGLIVLGMWLVLTKTSLGLFIRASMQNRAMASCMGVRTERVNMLTFGLGSGLAGLAGAFLSQIGNVGPSLGQNYIIDSFMVVVVGGVGSLGGTIISSFGIGGADQVLQQYLPDWAPGLAGVPFFGSFLQNLAQDAAVFGKILVLVAIILFLQWRPAGLFVTRSRSLDD